MGNQDDRLGSLLVFNDIALILSTYGVLLLFNYFIEPINSNTWIVCTFFVGIKILIVGIADITGIGKSYIVSLLFVLIADGIIILINQLMAFGLSLRLMLAMVIADLIIVLIAIFIWKRLGKDRVDLYEGEDWIYNEEPKKAPTPKPAVETATPAPSVPVSEVSTPKTQEKDNVIFDFQSLQNESIQKPEINEKPIFDNFGSEPLTAGDDILNFDEITQELPSEDEIQKALANEENDDILSSSFNYFDGLDIFNDIGQDETSEPEITFETNATPETKTEEISEKEKIKEPVIKETTEEVVETVEPELEAVEPIITEEVSKTEETEVPEETLEELVSDVEETKEESELVTEEIAQEEVSEEPEPVQQIKEEVKTEEVTPESVIEPFVFKLPEEVPEEEPIPLFIQSANDYNRITQSTIGLTHRFSMIPVNITQEQIDTFKNEVKEELEKLNTNFGKLANEYNNSLAQSNTVDRIENFTELGEDFSISQGETIIRENLNKLTEKEFISDQVVNTLLELISKLDNRIYNINFAEENLQERLLRDQQLEIERQRRQEEARKKEEQERQQRAQMLKERQKAEAEAKAKEEKAKGEARKAQEAEKKAAQKETPSISSNEILLQNGDMDIIIDAADLELLKEFLQQQDNN